MSLEKVYDIQWLLDNCASIGTLLPLFAECFIGLHLFVGGVENLIYLARGEQLEERFEEAEGALQERRLL